jgi:hypothetical protein
LRDQLVTQVVLGILTREIAVDHSSAAVPTMVSGILFLTDA